jgi:hypothetical protein
MTSTENTLDASLAAVLLAAAPLAPLAAAPLAPLAAPLVMSLAPSPEESVFSSLKDLITFINTHADFEDYAMIIARFQMLEEEDQKQSSFAMRS